MIILEKAVDPRNITQALVLGLYSRLKRKHYVQINAECHFHYVRNNANHS